MLILPPKPIPYVTIPSESSYHCELKTPYFKSTAKPPSDCIMVAAPSSDKLSELIVTVLPKVFDKRSVSRVYAMPFVAEMLHLLRHTFIEFITFKSPSPSIL